MRGRDMDGLVPGCQLDRLAARRAPPQRVEYGVVEVDQGRGVVGVESAKV